MPSTQASPRSLARGVRLAAAIAALGWQATLAEEFPGARHDADERRLCLSGAGIVRCFPVPHNDPRPAYFDVTFPGGHRGAVFYSSAYYGPYGQHSRGVILLCEGLPSSRLFGPAEARRRSAPPAGQAPERTSVADLAFARVIGVGETPVHIQIIAPALPVNRFDGQHEAA